MTTNDARTWWVVCPEWVAGPYYREGAADAKLVNVTSNGDCNESHKIVESLVRPRTRREQEAYDTHDADEWLYK